MKSRGPKTLTWGIPNLDYTNSEQDLNQEIANNVRHVLEAFRIKMLRLQTTPREGSRDLSKKAKTRLNTQLPPNSNTPSAGKSNEEIFGYPRM
ncbi:hypothetical protein J6590_048238 [Homalodisca vitripennis]|nr:hypothetical protein J6590_048238 [Homalodisca vitripennis]